MSKARRIKSRRQQTRPPFPGNGRELRTIEDVDASGEALLPDMPARVTYLTDPVLGGARPARLGPGGSVAEDDSGTVEPIPVVLFEPARILAMRNPTTGTVQEGKTEAIVAAGFGRLPDHPVVTIRPALGWELRRLPGELILRDPGGGVWARSKVTPDPAWVSAAASYQEVAVFYGPKLGVRTPDNTDPAAYSTAVRAAECRRGRRQGLATAAMVTWRGDTTDETLDWVTFRPGSFGCPLAGIFVPAAEFTRHGGPDTFGLVRLGDCGLAIPADPLRTFIAQVGGADVDLIDPGETAGFNMIAGMHDRAGINPAWRRAALGHGKVLVLTGRRLPGYPGREPRQQPDDLADLWAAVVQVRAA